MPPPCSDDHPLVHHQSIIYSELDSHHPLNNNSADSYSNCNIPQSERSSNDPNIPSRPAFASSLPPPRNPEELPKRLPENKNIPSSGTTELTGHNPHNPLLSSLSSSPPQRLPIHQNACIPNHTSNNANNALNADTTPIQPGRPLLHQANHPPLDTLSAVQTQPLPNPPLKKNGKPLAQCPYCGMTFKKLEHCQRHERTHTLARPYPCTVCSKTFARQDTLNRHLRLHSRSEGRVAVNKSSSQGQESQPQTSSPGALKSPPRKLPSSSIGPGADVLTLSPWLPSPSPLRRQVARERGLSLSALEHCSFPGHPARNVPVAGSGPRQSISLPLQRPQQQQQHLPPPFHSNGSQQHLFPNTSQIPSSQPPRSSTLSVDAGAGMSTEARRGSWCPGVQSLNEFAMFPTSEIIHSHSMSNHSPHALQRSLELGNWETNLTTTFGLVDAGIGPVPLSAPATCTNWSALGIDSGRTSHSYAASSSSMIPTWENLSHYEIQPRNKLNWPALGRLEEEDQVKPDAEQSNQNACQIILSSPSQPDSFDQPNSVDPKCLAGSSRPMLAPSTECENNASFWCLPTGSNAQTSSPGQPSYTVNANHQGIGDSIENHWSSSLEQTVDMFNPVIWQPPACQNGEIKVDNNCLSNPNHLSINHTWENNPWDEIVELGF